MSGTTLVRDVLYRCSTQLHDLAPQFTRWTERELIAWLNDGQRAIAKYMPYACSRVDALRLVTGTKQSIDSIPGTSIINGDGSTSVLVRGASLLNIRRSLGTDGVTPGLAMRIVAGEVLDSVYPGWHNRTGVPTQYIFDPQTPKVFYVSPGVAAGVTQWVEVAYLASPNELVSTGSFGMDGSSTTPISIDDKYVDDLVNYILARAYMKDAEFAADGGLAQAHSAQFIASINAQVAALTGANPNLQRLPFNPNLPGAAK